MKEVHTAFKSDFSEPLPEAIPLWAQLAGGLWAFIIVIFFLRQIFSAYLRFLGGG